MGMFKAAKMNGNLLRLFVFFGFIILFVVSLHFPQISGDNSLPRSEDRSKCTEIAGCTIYVQQSCADFPYPPRSYCSEVLQEASSGWRNVRILIVESNIPVAFVSLKFGKNITLEALTDYPVFNYTEFLPPFTIKVSGVEGFTMKNMAITQGDVGQPGVVVEASTATFINCIWYDLSRHPIPIPAQWSPIFVTQSLLSIIDCEFSGITMTTSDSTLHESTSALLSLKSVISIKRTLVKNCYFSGQRSFGAFRFIESEVMITDSQFYNISSNGTVSAQGGAIFSQSSTIHFKNCHFELNHALTSALFGTALGGAIAAIELRTNVFQNVSITNCTFERNGAYGSLVTSGGAAMFDGLGHLNITDSVFEANLVNIGQGTLKKSGSSCSGGAVSLTAFSTTIHGCRFDSNSVLGFNSYRSGTANGGALDASVAQKNAIHGTLNITNSVFWGNVVSLGQVYDATSSGGSVRGGAISLYSDRSIFFVYNTTFESNTAIGGTSPETGGSAYGGAIQAGMNELTAIILECSFFTNAAMAGDGILASGNAAAGAIDFQGQTLIVIGSRFAENSATVNPTGSWSSSDGYAYGGSVNVRAGSATVSIISSEFNNNKALGGRFDPIFDPLNRRSSGAGYGGAISINSLSTPLIEGCTFFENAAAPSFSSDAHIVGLGGAVWSRSVYIRDSNFSSNMGTSGAAVYANEIILDDSIFFSNKIQGDFNEGTNGGGALHSSAAYIRNCTFIANCASLIFSYGPSYGGSIFTTRVLAVSDSYFESNFLYTDSDNFGGAIAAVGSASISNCTFHQNTAKSTTLHSNVLGGSIFLNITGNLNLEEVSIDGSRAHYGGAIFLGGSWRNASVNNVTIRDCNAAISGGAVAILPSITLPQSAVDGLIGAFAISESSATHYAPGIMTRYSTLHGLSTSAVFPGFPFEYQFWITDSVGNVVKDSAMEMEVVSSNSTQFMSGYASNAAQMNVTSGFFTWPGFTIWEMPNEVVSLTFNFSKAPQVLQFPVQPIKMEVVMVPCPPGFHLIFSNQKITCLACPPERYSFGGDCHLCPTAEPCAASRANDFLTYDVYQGHAAFPLATPTEIVSCPISMDGTSSCSSQSCHTVCGNMNNVSVSVTYGHPPFTIRPISQRPNSTCITQCDRVECKRGYQGIVCGDCKCDASECWYQAEKQCLPCGANWPLHPTIIITVLSLVLFIFLKGLLLTIALVIIGAAGIILVAVGAVSPLLGTFIFLGYVMAAETLIPYSSGLVKTLVFFIQTGAAFIDQRSWPFFLNAITSNLDWTQFRITGLECLSHTLFKDPFRRFMLVMVGPPVMIALLAIAWVLSEFLRKIRIIRAIQDFDPLIFVPGLRKRIQDAFQQNTYTLQYSMLVNPDTNLMETTANSLLAAENLDEQTVERRSRSVLRKIAKTSLFILFAVHFELCNTIFEVFAPCIPIPSLHMAYSSTHRGNICWDSNTGFWSVHTSHGKMAVAAIFFLVIYVIGIPALFAGFLYRNRTSIKERNAITNSWLGLLYNSYRPSVFYFELFWLLRRVLLAAVISATPSSYISRTTVPILIILISTFITNVYKPLASKTENYTEVLSLLCLVLVMATNRLTRDVVAVDAFLWRWTSFLTSMIVIGIILALLILPLLRLCRPRKED